MGLFKLFILADSTMIDQLRAIAIFREVVDTGSFRAAAKSLKLSPSVVSHHVSQLEQQLGTALLYRSTRKISLTDDGDKLFVASQKMAEAVNQALRDISVTADQLSGRLRLAVPGNMFERPPFIDHVIAFARQHPKVQLAINFSDQRVELIGSELDLAIRSGWLENSQYKARRLYDMDHVIIAAPAYLAGKRSPKTVDDLGKFTWIKLLQLPINRQLTNHHGRLPKINPPIAMEVDGVVAMCQMVKSGLGLAAVPKHVVEDELRDGSLVALSPGWSLKPISVYAVWPNNVSEDSLTLRFVRFLADRLSGDVVVDT